MHHRVFGIYLYMGYIYAWSAFLQSFGSACNQVLIPSTQNDFRMLNNHKHYKTLIIKHLRVSVL
jgi:hypothetical protein